MSIIWATRGRTWGFRFLRRGGRTDPLLAYEDAFSGDEEAPEVFRRHSNLTAVRFLDPLDRKDRAGRVIPHEFVLEGELATQVTSVEEAIQLVWPLVSEEYARVWQLADPPAARD